MASGGRAPSTAAATMPTLSARYTTVSTPAAARPWSTRRTIDAFSWLGTTEA
jgi:hypothetical protein